MDCRFLLDCCMFWEFLILKCKRDFSQSLLKIVTLTIPHISARCQNPSSVMFRQSVKDVLQNFALFYCLERTTVVDRFSRHRFSRNPDLVENFAVTDHFYSIKIQYSRKFDLVD